MGPFETLEKRVSALGNHYEKFIIIIKRFKDPLIQALKQSGKLMQIHLIRSSFSAAEEMKIISKLSDDKKTKVEFLSCYYALQFLHMNLRNLDILQLGIASDEIHTEIYHRFMMQIGKDFRELTSAYLQNLLDIYMPPGDKPDFFVCSVGTRADQDDIDLGIITEDNEDVTELNKAFQRITQDMLVYATPLHLYLSEHVGEQLYTTTISEYTELLEKQIHDVVIISELLNARLIAGDEDLFEKFKKKVVSRYYFSDIRKNVRFHEGFLRGILGEVRALLITPLKTDAISPKDDAIRMLKSVLYAKKSIYGLEQVNAWDVIEALIDKEPHLRSEYQLLFKATSFLEIFKFLLHMYVVQEETIRLSEVDNRQFSLIAAKMGYEPIGAVSSWDQLLIDYYRYVREVRKLCDFLIDDIKNHLSSISLSMKLLKSSRITAKNGGYSGILAVDFIKTAEFFTGTKFWEDVLQLLRDDERLIEIFIEGFERLNKEETEELIQQYIEWTHYSVITVIRLISILGKKQETTLGDTIYIRMNNAFLQFIEKTPYITERICRVFSHYPQYIHEYLQYLPDSSCKYLDNILSRPVVMDELTEYQNQLNELCKIHKFSSRYFHRFFHRVISNHPEYLRSLTNVSQLFKIASGLLAMVDVYPDHTRKKEVLGDYYDLEFLRVGIGTIRGVDLNITNKEFTEFCDNYMRKLFDICTEEVEPDATSGTPSTDSFAILAAGGHARSQAYDDDYDLIAVVDTDNEDVIRHATKVITKMNREILKRGVLPHYRLGEILEGFVTPISKIVDYLSSGDEESFIDLSQLLGARMIVGSDVMKSVLKRKILDRFVFEQRSFYIQKMIMEMQNRHALIGDCRSGTCNIKETKGGLRDIEAVALMLKAYLKLNKPLTSNFFHMVKAKFPDISQDLDNLSAAVYMLRTIRNLYRITIAAEDNISCEDLTKLSVVFFQSSHPEWGNADHFYEEIQETLSRSAHACDRVVTFLNKTIRS
jgi:hypothetical protein